jgi:glycosyltransferase involved in cell wall biosynthesis
MTNSQHEISVVMTVFNGEKFLREAVQSILDQTFSEFEFIIVDDGSTDRSAEYMRSFSDRRIRFFPFDHVGRAAALNYGLAQATAPLVAFADADDIASPHRLQLEYDALQNNAEVDAVGSWYQIIDEQGGLMREKRLPTSHKEITELMPVQCSVCFPAALVRKETIVQAGSFNEKLTAAIDYDFWLRILDTARFMNLPMSLIKFRISPQSISGRLKTTQKQQGYAMGMDYLQKKYTNTHDAEMKAKISMQLGKVEYYAGNMAAARSHVARLLWNNPDMFIAWRYYLASLLGKNVFAFLRRTGIAGSVGNVLRGSSAEHDYFMP